jgi:hypothetical protein
MYKRSRYYPADYYYTEIEEEQVGLLHDCCLKRTSTYYQWNRAAPPAPPTSQNKKKIHSTNCPINPEKKSWEQRRSVLLKKYSAIQDE